MFELGALAKAPATDRASLRSFLSLFIFWMESELWVTGPEKRELGTPGFSSFSELSSSISVSMGLSSALDTGWTLLAFRVVGSSVVSGVVWGLLSCWDVFMVDVVCILFILDPGLLGPGMRDVCG